MALYFISAASGTGKTTLMQELCRRGKEAHDTDVACVRRSRLTGEVIDFDRAKTEGYDWIFPSESLHALKSKSATNDVYLLGYIDNACEVIESADEFIWMEIPLEVLNERLNKRTKEYGKSASERQIILSAYEHMGRIIGADVFRLDATKSVELIADDLLYHINNK